jgi:uncharacterized membrane protein YhiD involved in acid resistance
MHERETNKRTLGAPTNFLAAISWQTFAITNKNQQEKERYRVSVFIAISEWFSDAMYLT